MAAGAAAIPLENSAALSLAAFNFKAAFANGAAVEVDEAVLADLLLADLLLADLLLADLLLADLLLAYLLLADLLLAVTVLQKVTSYIMKLLLR
jgi:hypothetical protein